MLVCESVRHTCYNYTGLLKDFWRISKGLPNDFGLYGLQNLLVYKLQPPGLRDLFLIDPFPKCSLIDTIIGCVVLINYQNRTVSVSAVNKKLYQYTPSKHWLNTQSLLFSDIYISSNILHKGRNNIQVCFLVPWRPGAKHRSNRKVENIFKQICSFIVVWCCF